MASLNAQAQAPDDPSKTLVSNSHLLSLRAYMEELSASFNAQDQAPDDLHTQDRQCAPIIFVYENTRDEVLWRVVLMDPEMGMLRWQKRG